MNETINTKLAQLLAENPELPVKVMVSEELEGDFIGEWCIAELNGCELTEYTCYEPDGRYYFGCDKYDLRCAIHDEIDEEHYGEGLSNKEIDRMTKERLEQIKWHPCILLRVGA